MLYPGHHKGHRGCFSSNPDRCGAQVMWIVFRFIIYATFSILTCCTNASPCKTFLLLASNSIDMCESSACWRNIAWLLSASCCLCIRGWSCLVSVAFIYCGLEIPNYVLGVKLIFLDSSLTLGICKRYQRYSADWQDMLLGKRITLLNTQPRRWVNAQDTFYLNSLICELSG